MEDSDLWKRTLGRATGTSNERKHNERLRSALRIFREKASLLAEEIPGDLPFLTDHSVRHLDALWEVATLLTGKSVPFNPLEAFVFGGAVLLHDLANSIAAFPNGLDDLKGQEWDDLVHATYRRQVGRPPTPQEIAVPDRSLLPEILLIRLRQVHAKQAEKLATLGFYQKSKGKSGDRLYLIDDEEIRGKLGLQIGRIAHSHHWNIAKVEQEFGGLPLAAPPPFPEKWTIDRLKIAVVLRAADAAQIDSRRAPSFVFALRSPSGESFKHWNFQNLLSRPTLDQKRLVYNSYRPFRTDEADSWWLCFDAMGMIHRELNSIEEVLTRCRKFRLTARGVLDHASAERTETRIATDGWVPVDARISIGNATGIVQRFGGSRLYGANPLVPLRELISNAADAVRARRTVEGRNPNWGSILVSVSKDDAGDWLAVEDNGVGMSADVLTGPLLDFGTSYWDSALAREEHPGLYAKGFTPTGEFGIGFFSVFMLGDLVQVVSQPALKPDKRTPPCHVLEFEGGPARRPLLRVATPNEALKEPGTRVRIRLRTDSEFANGLRSPSMRDVAYELGAIAARRKPETRIARQLARYVTQIAPCVDVDVFVKAAQNSPVVGANDWTTIPFGALAERVGQRARSNTRDAGVDLSRVFLKDSKPVARLGVPSEKSPMTQIVVGGLATGAAIPGFPGTIVGESPDLARATANAVAFDAAELRTWLAFIESALQERLEELGEAQWYASAFLETGLRPRKLKCFRRGDEWLSTEHLESVELPNTVVLALSQEFTWGDDRIGFTDVRDSHRLHLDSGVVVAPAIEAGFMAPTVHGHPRWGLEMLPDFVVRDGEPFPWTLSLLAVEAVSKNWGQSLDELLKPLRREGGWLIVEFGQKIGLYAGEQITSTALVLRREGEPGRA